MIATVLSALLIAKPEVSAWVVGFNLASVKRFEERADQLNTVFLEYYAVTKEGTPTRRPKQYGVVFNKAREIAQKNHVQLFAMISNYVADEGQDGFDQVRMSKAVATAESRMAFVDQIVKMLKEDKAQGIDLDLESMKSDDKDRYSALVTTLSKALHKEGLKLSVTVHPKQDLVGNWDGLKAQDYKALGLAADRFNVMTYDFSWSSGPEGSIAPNDWVERVITFASTQVPANKIGLGIACYGYDWSKKPATSLNWEEFNSKAAKLDPASGELINGKVHFSGAEAFRQKYALASKLGVGSVAFWYCGSEDLAIWSFLPKRR